MKAMAFIVALFGVMSFVFGIMAETKKPAGGIRVKKNGFVICKYQSDPMILWGYAAVGCHALSTLFGLYSLFYPYKGKRVPRNILFRNNGFNAFFKIALITAGLAATLLLWPILTEKFHIKNNIHHNIHTDCPTAKTGLLGGASFVSLDASLFWMATLMLAGNAREDYLEDDEKNNKTENGSIVVDVVTT